MRRWETEPPRATTRSPTAMLGRLIPRDQEFFTLFNELASHLSSSEKLLHELFEQPESVQEIVKAIKAVEHKEDQLTHEINASIAHLYVPQFDRDDYTT